jgi:hypothetical protein
MVPIYLHGNKEKLGIIIESTKTYQTGTMGKNKLKRKNVQPIILAKDGRTNSRYIY